MSSVEPSPRKRQRLEYTRVETDPSTCPPQQHEKHWYDDGSVVLHVEDTLFRVHRSILAKHSEIFRDAFALPAPVEAEEHDGFPLVRLRGDRIQGWNELLDALYDSFTYFDTLNSLDLDAKLTAAMSLLRVSTKYRIDYCRAKCLAILSQHFVSSPTYEPAAQLPSFGQACDMVKMARETNAMSLLPCALLMVACAEDHSAIYSTDLPLFDKISVYHARLELIRLQRECMFPFVQNIWRPNRTCERNYSGTVCAALLQDESSRYAAAPEAMYFFVDDASFWPTDKTRAKPPCKSCRAIVLRELAQGRQKIWEQLPELFHLGKNWDELRQMQDAESGC
ncbi:uncharacterized protein SCHCODRAFT_02676049 [Schizophyllum commune H4-8]|uniref:BTB domain-containing protein n=1 Tax=Schizophyllum commune (strain H4-8 / FGSC 9210) TaxID=578458 RepID=D8PYV7_SCHCM|nr:uncharacterized protein SCHCODRAFT_02676049 [Schizophyllum commune H4-8]KAI5896125.1 hypothetical protein SCHCODRAFT_02676049 [Schizophyllum commune H4-8]